MTEYNQGGWLPPATTYTAPWSTDECILEVHPTYARCVRPGHVGLNQPHNAGVTYAVGGPIPADAPPPISDAADSRTVVVLDDDTFRCDYDPPQER